MSNADQNNAIDDPSVDEVVGQFPSDAALHEAMDRLSAAGFGRNRLGTPKLPDEPGLPTAAHTDAAKTEDDTRQLRTLRSSTAAAAAAMAGAAAVVATGGAAAAAIAVAAGAGLAAGGGMVAANNAADAVTSTQREAARGAGSLRLIVALSTASEQAVVEQAMRDAGAISVSVERRASAGFAGRAKLA